ncbi:MAG: GatB/YqeY domain-containing protein [Patescibacteria group bacterium]
MKLYEQMQEDVKIAMKGRDMQALDILRVVLASIKNKAIELKKELEDAEVIDVIKSDTKKLQDALEDFTKGAREDLIEKTKAEIEILKKYLPPEMTDKELREKVMAKVEAAGATDVKDLGKAMGELMKDLKGAVDGSRVKKMLEEILKAE